MKKSIYTDTYKKLISKLIQARQASKLSQKDVASLIDTTQSYVSKIEAGQKKIDVIELKNLARIYKRDIRYFLD